MKYSTGYLLFGFVVGSAIAIELILNKSFRRQAVEIEEKAKNLINVEIAKATETLQELKDKGSGWIVREEITNAFEKAA